MEIRRRSESKLLDMVELEVLIPANAGKLQRGQAVEMVAEELKVEKGRVGLISLRQQSGTRDVFGRFRVYGSEEALKKTHPRHLVVRLMTKEEREKLKEERKKAKTQAPPETAPAKSAKAK